jgi:hypothetical protein
MSRSIRPGSKGFLMMTCDEKEAPALGRGLPVVSEAQT